MGQGISFNPSHDTGFQHYKPEEQHAFVKSKYKFTGDITKHREMHIWDGAYDAAMRAHYDANRTVRSALLDYSLGSHTNMHVINYSFVVLRPCTKG